MMQRFFFVLVVLGYNGIANAQNVEFLRMVDRQEDNIRLNRWDELLITAPDMIIEEPTRGEGYYYTAFAFFKMGDVDAANGYLEKAASLAEPDLTVKIDALKAMMTASTNEEDGVAKAEQLAVNGSPDAAANHWLNLWKNNKSNLDFALNAVSIYVDLKKYPEALEILNDPVMLKEEESGELIRMINNTREMRAINGYNEAMKSANAAFNKKNYQTAIDKCTEALKHRPGDGEAKRLKGVSQDELAWKTARDVNSIAAYETYLDGNTMRKHEDEAHAIIKRGLFYRGEKSAKANDLAEMEKYFNRYVNEYPNDENRQKALDIMCTTYNSNGDQKALSKDRYSQNEAAEFYAKARKVCMYGGDLDDKIAKAKRLSKRYGRSNRDFVTYVYDTISRFGFSIGSLNNRKVGSFVTVRADGNIFTSETSYTVNNDGVLDGSVFSDVRFTREVRTGNIELMGGITKKIAYPFWLYLGAGGAYNVVFWEMDEYTDSGEYYGTEWVRNTDETKFHIVTEPGIIIDFTGFTLRWGIKVYDFKTPIMTFGIGYSTD